MMLKKDLLLAKVHLVWIGFWMAANAFPVHAQERIYRCGNEYTNAPINPKSCDLLQGQTITVIEGTRPSGASGRLNASTLPGRTKVASSMPLAAPSLGVQNAASTQISPGSGTAEPVDAHFREAQKRTILVAELKQARERHAQLVQEYNEGEPEKVGGEARNHQKYLDRLQSLKAGISRAERDMDSLQRELARLPLAQVAQP